MRGPTPPSQPSGQPGAGSPASVIAGTRRTCGRSACSRFAAASADPRHPAAVRALADRVGRHVGHPVAVNIDGALAVALIALGLAPDYGDLLFAIARSFGLAAHIVEERERETPMRMIDPTAALYDGDPVPEPIKDGQG